MIDDVGLMELVVDVFSSTDCEPATFKGAFKAGPTCKSHRMYKVASNRVRVTRKYSSISCFSEDEVKAT